MFLTGSILKQSIVSAYSDKFILQFDPLIRSFQLLKI